jgi:AcrR family transcriptional regulator
MDDRLTGKKGEILAAARFLFLEAGYEGARLREVARRAGVTTGSLYHHFSGKDELFGEVCCEGLSLLLARLRAARQASARLARGRRLACLLDAYVDYFLQDRGYFELNERMHTGDRPRMPAAAEARLEKLSREILGEISRVLHEAEPAAPAGEIDRKAVLLAVMAEGLFACARKGTLDRFGVSFAGTRDLMLESAELFLRRRRKGK